MLQNKKGHKRNYYYLTEERLQEVHQNIADYAEDQIKVTCRICLEETNLNQKNLYQNSIFKRPCLCRGSVQYAHESCIVQWLNNVLIQKKKQGRDEKKFTCQVCKQCMIVNWKSELKCLKCSQIKQRLRASWYKILGYILFSLVFFIIAQLLGYFAYINQVKQFTLVAILASILLFSTGIVIIIIKIIMKYFIQEEQRVIGVLQILPKPSFRR